MPYSQKFTLTVYEDDSIFVVEEQGARRHAAFIGSVSVDQLRNIGSPSLSVVPEATVEERLSRLEDEVFSSKSVDLEPVKKTIQEQAIDALGNGEAVSFDYKGEGDIYSMRRNDVGITKVVNDYFVGYDYEADGIRSFRFDRITSDLNPAYDS